MTGPPDVAPAGGLCLRRASRRVFDETSPLAGDPRLRAYLSDMVGRYGLALREDLLARGAGHSYGEMAEPLIETVVGAGPAVDLLVLAFGIHDIRLGRATATYLSGRCPGRPLGFAVTDQGVAAAFTALRLIGAYAGTGAARRALLLVVEQSALYYELAEPAPVPDRHAAVGLLLETVTGAAPAVVRQHSGVGPGRVAALLAGDLAELSGDRPDAPVLAGAGIDPSIVDGAVRAPAGQPYTGLWWELCGRLTGPAEGPGPVLLADYDAALGYLCTAKIQLAAG